jgi:hypothetical protein
MITPSFAWFPESSGKSLSTLGWSFLESRIELNEQRLIALDPTLDIETIRDYLETIPLICAGGEPAGPIGQLPHRERFYWIVAPRSTVIQTSRVHTGLCTDLPHVIEHLLDTMVRPCKQSKAPATPTV